MRLSTALSVALVLVVALRTEPLAASEARARLVRDINPGSPSALRLGSNPPFSYLTDVDGTLFFVARDGFRGWELWKSDGTKAGTVLVKDITLRGGSAPYLLTDVGGTLFFEANDGVHGSELWKSDGTETGTVMVKDIRRGSRSGFPLWLSQSRFVFMGGAGGTLFFSVADGSHGLELWKSDGTEPGTVMVKDINPTGGSFIHGLTAVGDKVYFSADDGTHGWELWRSDGTEARTVLVKDINLEDGSYPTDLAVGDTVYFSADDGTHGVETLEERRTRPGRSW